MFWVWALVIDLNQHVSIKVWTTSPVLAMDLNLMFELAELPVKVLGSIGWSSSVDFDVEYSIKK